MKKLLSVLLALVMLCGVGVISTSAAYPWEELTWEQDAEITTLIQLNQAYDIFSHDIFAAPIALRLEAETALLDQSISFDAFWWEWRDSNTYDAWFGFYQQWDDAYYRAYYGYDGTTTWFEWILTDGYVAYLETMIIARGNYIIDLYFDGLLEEKVIDTEDTFLENFNSAYRELFSAYLTAYRKYLAQTLYLQNCLHHEQNKIANLTEITAEHHAFREWFFDDFNVEIESVDGERVIIMQTDHGGLNLHFVDGKNEQHNLELVEIDNKYVIVDASGEVISTEVSERTSGAQSLAIMNANSITDITTFYEEAEARLSAIIDSIVFAKPPEPEPPAWWDNLPSFFLVILRWVFFGWIWM